MASTAAFILLFSCSCLLVLSTAVPYGDDYEEQDAVEDQQSPFAVYYDRRPWNTAYGDDYEEQDAVEDQQYPLAAWFGRRKIKSRCYTRDRRCSIERGFKLIRSKFACCRFFHGVAFWDSRTKKCFPCH